MKGPSERSLGVAPSAQAGFIFEVSLGIADSTSNLRIHHRVVVDTPTVMGRLQGL
jgi:hypothetical protein